MLTALCIQLIAQSTALRTKTWHSVETEPQCDRTGEIIRKRILAKQSKHGLPSNLSVFDFMDDMADGQSWYTTHMANNEVCFDNWGFNDGEGKDNLGQVKKSSTVSEGDCSFTDTYGQKLYKFVVTDGLGEKPLKGKTVLEVGCGRGKGSAYIAQNFMPNECIAVDLNAPRIKVANRFWGETPNLNFKVGSALDLPIENATIDFVLNVESSIHYPNFQKFVSEVYRVLKPGGVFSWTAPLMNRGDTVSKKKEAFTQAGFSLLKTSDITSKVVSSRREHLAQAPEEEFARLCSSLDETGDSSPWAWWHEMRALPGSMMFQAMASGEMPYMRILAQKV